MARFKPSEPLPDLRSEFINELTEKIIYWRSKRTNEGDLYATAYEKLLHAVLAPTSNP